MRHKTVRNKVTYFPVGSADMSLVQLENGFTILVDCYLQEKATQNKPTVADDLYERLPRDDKNRPYVDVFLLTHPDQDHCKGAKEFLHLDRPDKYNDNPDSGVRKKIFIREMWSSPLIYRRRSCHRRAKKYNLCDDAVAINTEAKQRVKIYKEKYPDPNADGNRILILGSDYKDDDGNDRLEGLDGIRYNIDESIPVRNESNRIMLHATVLAPLPPSEVDGGEDVLTKNNSSVIMQMFVRASNDDTTGNLLLFGGDAEVEIWRQLWDKHKNKKANPLTYDILLAPHHCSWGVLSGDAASDENAKADPKARAALERCRNNAYIVASSEPVVDNEDQPPMLRAKNEYIDILKKGKSSDDHFLCTGEFPTKISPKPLTFDLTPSGPKAPSRRTKTTSPAVAPFVIPQAPRPHG